MVSAVFFFLQVTKVPNNAEILHFYLRITKNSRIFAQIFVL